MTTRKKANGKDKKTTEKKNTGSAYKVRALESLNKKRSDAGKSAGKVRSRTELMEYRRLYHGSGEYMRGQSVSKRIVMSSVQKDSCLSRNT